MAIYHFSAKVISRSSGSSATAAAAYRAGEKIVDVRTGEIHDYTRKKGVDSSWISAPDSAPDWVFNRQKLWNEVESVEIRRDSQLAREINIALPTELDRAEQLKLIREFVEEQFVKEGMVADVGCHDLNTHNPHAHIMLTMREINKEGFNPKKNRDWNRKELLEKQREAWANQTNKALEMAGVNQTIDHRSLEIQGVERMPQIHLGVVVNAMRKRGIATEREEQYLEIEAANKKIRGCEFHLELIDRLESSYRSNPELDPGFESTTPDSEQVISPDPEKETVNKPNHGISSPKSTQDQITKTSAESKPDRPSPVSFGQQKQIIKTAKHFLQYAESDVWNSEQGSKNYDLMTNEKGSLTIEAKDGRGEILRYQNGEIVTQRLTEKDVEQFQEVSIALEQQALQVAHTAARFLHLMGRSVWNSEHGSRNYNFMTNSQGLLVIEAKDGRGEILRRQDGKIAAQKLTSKDIERFKEINIALDQKLEQVKSQQREQGRGFER